MPSSAPLNIDSRIISAAREGPIVTMVTFTETSVETQDIASLHASAISNAFKSSGLKMAGRAARLMVPSSFMASLPTLCVSGTCFANTTILKSLLFIFFSCVFN